MPTLRNLLTSTIAVLTIAASVAMAQTGTSRITGRIVDAKQASIPGATVSVHMNLPV